MSEHVGKKGERIEIKGVIARASFVRADDFNFPPKPIFAITIRDDAGNAYVYFGCPVWIDWTAPEERGRKALGLAEVTNIGVSVHLDATVKEHNEFKGEKQTVIARPLIRRQRRGANPRQRSFFSEWGNA